MQNDGSIAIDNYGATASNFDDASPVKQFFRNKWVRLILAIDFVAIIAVIAALVSNGTKTAVINFDIAPVDAKVQLNGQGDYSSGTYQIHPGTYDVTISHEGLESKTLTLNLQSGYNTTLTTFLKGENDNFDFYTYKANYDSLQKLISIASSTDNQTTDQDPSAEQFIQDFQEQYGLFQTALPITYTEYQPTAEGRIISKDVKIKADQGDDCLKTLCVKALMILVDESSVNQLLLDKGFNLEYYEVNYEAYL